MRAGTPNTFPDFLYGKGYREFGVTNESLEGIKERGLFVRTMGSVDTFIGVGTPVKVLLQAAVLQPTEYIGFVDISGQNIRDAMLLVSALQAGFSSVAEYVKSPQGREVRKTTDDVFPDQLESKLQSGDGVTILSHHEIIHKSDNTLSSLDYDLSQALSDLGIIFSDLVKVIQSVKKIRFHFDSIKSADLWNEVLHKPPTPGKMIVIDASNIPLESNVLDASEHNPLILFGYNGTYQSAVRDRMPEFGYAKRPYDDVHFWNYPLNDEKTRALNIKGGMAIGMGSYKDGYSSIRRNVDNLSNQW
jgi:hypothetical protein